MPDDPGKPVPSRPRAGPGRGKKKSPIVAARVVARRMAGETQRQIAKAEGMARVTVQRILSEPEYKEIVRAYREHMLELIPDSIAVFKKTLTTALDGNGAIKMKRLVRPGRKVDPLWANKLIEHAYSLGLANSRDAVKVSLKVLQGTQVLVTREEHDVANPLDLYASYTDEELRETAQRLYAKLFKPRGN